MEEMLGHVAGAQQVLERWMAGQPEEQAWHSYINLELRYQEVERATPFMSALCSCTPL